MRRTRPLYLAPCVAAALVGLPALFAPPAAAADPPQYSVRFLDGRAGFDFAGARRLWGGSAFGDGSTVVINGDRRTLVRHVLRWDVATGAVTDLTPSGGNSFSQGAGGGYVVGSGGPSHAMLWDARTGAATDLHAWGVSQSASAAYGATAEHIVGYAAASLGTPSTFRAALWEVGARSYSDLHPAGYRSSDARAVAGGVAAGSADTDVSKHAFAWDVASRGGTDIHPSFAGVDYSYATGVGQTHIGGVGGSGVPTDPTSVRRALLWDRVSLTAMDVHPAGARSSEIRSVGSNFAAGSVTAADGRTTAMLWDVLTGARFDIHAALGAEYAGHRSYLHDIDAEGNVLGTVYGTFLGDERDFVLRPLAAAAVPEPGTAPLLSLAGLIGVTSIGRGPLRRKQARTRMDTCTPP